MHVFLRLLHQAAARNTPKDLLTCLCGLNDAAEQPPIPTRWYDLRYMRLCRVKMVRRHRIFPSILPSRDFLCPIPWSGELQITHELSSFLPRSTRASCVLLASLLLDLLSEESVTQVICSLKDETFLRYAIPYTKCIDVRWYNQSNVDLFHLFTSLRVRRVLGVLNLAGPQLSDKGFMGSSSDRSLIQSVQTAIRHRKFLSERSCEIHLECCIVPEPDTHRYVRAF